MTRYSWQLLKAGPLWLDGGSMFGVVPRVIWSKLTPPDDRGRIELAHNCLLLTDVDHPKKKTVIEVGSGDKFDAKSRDIFGLAEDVSIASALRDANVDPAEIEHVIVSHLHFDHAGGLTTLASDKKPVPTFPNAKIHVQKREWEDAIANNSVMTRTYLRENLDPIRDHAKFHHAPLPFKTGHHPSRDDVPPLPLGDRVTEILPDIFAFLVPGHTWGQQAIMFRDDRDRSVVFTPDVMPTVHHIGAAYNMAYDVEPFVSMITRRWFLQEAATNDWLLVIDHEPKTPCVRVKEDGKGWFTLVPEN